MNKIHNFGFGFTVVREAENLRTMNCEPLEQKKKNDVFIKLK